MSVIKLIWAQDLNGAIGKDNSLPWSVPEDLKRFTELTTGHTVVMGRNTWDSLPSKFKPLPNRKNLVLSRTVGNISGGAVISSLDDLPEDEVIWVLGGSSVYTQVLDMAEIIEITRIHTVIEDADSFVPNIMSDDRFVFVDKSSVLQSIKGLSFNFETYRKI